MTTDYRALCAELALALAEWQLGGGPPEDTADADLITRASAALAQPEPEGPSDEELLRAVLARWGRTTLTPIPVSERPWERDGFCDAEGRCWLLGKIEGDWRLINANNSGVPRLSYCFSHCLPAHALPLPAAPGEGQ